MGISLLPNTRMGKDTNGAWTWGDLCTECGVLLFARRGSLKHIKRWESVWFNWPRQGMGGHSRKPEAFIDLVEQVSPPPYLELFARRHRLGWDVWGLESANTAQLEERE